MSKNQFPYNYQKELVLDFSDGVGLTVESFTKNSLTVITANIEDTKDMDWNEYKKLVKFIFRK